MTQAAKTRKPAKTVTIIARFAWKNIDRVCYKVRGSNGEEHQVLFNGTQPATCTCKGFKAYHKCYHVAQLTEKEQARREVDAPVAEIIETTPITEVLAAAQAEMTAFASEYEVLAMTKKPTSTCKHCGRNHHSNECWL